MNKISMSRKLKDGEYYKYDKDLGFINIDPKDIIYKTHTIDSLEKYYNGYLDLKKSLKEQVNHLSTSLKEYDIDINSEEINYTIGKCVELLNLLTVKVDSLNTFKIDSNGYVTDFNNDRYILSRKEIKVPEDLNNGYYKANLKEGKIEFVLDENKYQEEMI